MFEITIKADTMVELLKKIIELSQVDSLGEPPAPKATPRKAKATPAPAPEPEAAPADDEEDLGFDPNEVGEPMPATAMAVVDAGTGKPVEASAPVQMTLDDVKVAAAKLASTDTPALVAILKKYGAPNLSGVPKDQLADFAADVMEALG